MGVQERKAREKAQLRKLIIDTATIMFTSAGYENTSLRKIAAEIEYAPATIYLHFKDKSDLFRAIQEQTFEQFKQALNEFDFIKDPLGRLRAIANNYVKFAMAYPELYKLMFSMEAPIANVADMKQWKPGQECFALIRQSIEACNEKNLIRKMTPEESTLIFWSFLHGLAMLASTGRLFMIGDKSFIREHLKTYIDRMMETIQLSYF